MKQSRRGERANRVCASIVETTERDALRAIEESGPLADLVELRMDYLPTAELSLLLNARERPFIVTNRRKEDGGRYAGDEGSRLRILREAIDLGAEYVDVEMSAERSGVRDLIENKQKARVVLSFHDFQETPSSKKLQNLCDRMIRLGADVAKIVTFAASWEDNLRVLSLIPYARKKKQEIVAFCMGEKGKISRVVSPLLGAAWTYASLSKGRAAAPGQMTIREIRDIWERLK